MGVTASEVLKAHLYVEPRTELRVTAYRVHFYASNGEHTSIVVDQLEVWKETDERTQLIRHVTPLYEVHEVRD